MADIDELAPRYFNCEFMGLLTVSSCRKNREQSKSKWLNSMIVKPINRACCAKCTRVIKMEDTIDPQVVHDEAQAQVDSIKGRKLLYAEHRPWMFEEA